MGERQHHDFHTRLKSIEHSSQLSNSKGNIACIPAPLQLGMLHRCIIHVRDTDANSKSAAGWLEDTSKVQKYVMSDEDYTKRENTYKQFKLMKQKVGA